MLYLDTFFFLPTFFPTLDAMGRRGITFKLFLVSFQILMRFGKCRSPHKGPNYPLTHWFDAFSIGSNDLTQLLLTPQGHQPCPAGFEYLKDLSVEGIVHEHADPCGLLSELRRLEA